ncbi:MAG: ISAs1 family transposase, partial [Saprospiraceae bacterium]|nr:ISAs1 family transposase [Saprospiraceae bacterium]
MEALTIQTPKRIKMEYTNTEESWQENSAEGTEFEPGSLFEQFTFLLDPRMPRGKRYSLALILTLIVSAKLCGEDTPIAIADWAKNRAAVIIAKELHLTYLRMPHHSTYRRILEIVDNLKLEERGREYLKGLKKDKPGEVVAIDGKTLRGTRERDEERGDHMLAAYLPEQELLIAQVAVENKENEIVGAPKLLEAIDLAGKVLTADAMHTQKELSRQAVEKGGDYLFPAKENQKHVFEAIERLFAPDQPKPGFGKVQNDFVTDIWQGKPKHGRIEKRTLTCSCLLNDYLDWPYLAQVYKLERHFSWIYKGAIIKTSNETEYGITSLSRKKASPRRLNQIRRMYWGIETKLHYRRDVTFHEDATRMTRPGAGRNLSVIHNLVLGIISHCGYRNAAEARRFFSANTLQA